MYSLIFKKFEKTKNIVKHENKITGSFYYELCVDPLSKFD